MWNRMNGAGTKSECLGELDIKIGLRAEVSRAVPGAADLRVFLDGATSMQTPMQVIR